MSIVKSLYPPVVETYLPAFDFAKDEYVRIYFDISEYNSIDNISHVQVSIYDSAKNVSIINTPAHILYFAMPDSFDETTSDGEMNTEVHLVGTNEDISYGRYYINIDLQYLDQTKYQPDNVYKVQLRLGEAGAEFTNESETNRYKDLFTKIMSSTGDTYNSYSADCSASIKVDSDGNIVEDGDSKPFEQQFLTKQYDLSSYITGITLGDTSAPEYASNTMYIRKYLYDNYRYTKLTNDIIIQDTTLLDFLLGPGNYDLLYDEDKNISGVELTTVASITNGDDSSQSKLKFYASRGFKRIGSYLVNYPLNGGSELISGFESAASDSNIDLEPFKFFYLSSNGSTYNLNVYYISFNSTTSHANIFSIGDNLVFGDSENGVPNETRTYSDGTSIYLFSSSNYDSQGYLLDSSDNKILISKSQCINATTSKKYISDYSYLLSAFTYADDSEEGYYSYKDTQSDETNKFYGSGFSYKELKQVENGVLSKIYYFEAIYYQSMLDLLSGQLSTETAKQALDKLANQYKSGVYNEDEVLKGATGKEVSELDANQKESALYALYATSSLSAEFKNDTLFDYAGEWNLDTSTITTNNVRVSQQYLSAAIDYVQSKLEDLDNQIATNYINTATANYETAIASYKATLSSLLATTSSTGKVTTSNSLVLYIRSLNQAIAKLVAKANNIHSQYYGGAVLPTTSKSNCSYVWDYDGNMVCCFQDYYAAAAEVSDDDDGEADLINDIDIVNISENGKKALGTNIQTSAFTKLYGDHAQLTTDYFYTFDEDSKPDGATVATWYKLGAQVKDVPWTLDNLINADSATAEENQKAVEQLYLYNQVVKNNKRTGFKQGNNYYIGWYYNFFDNNTGSNKCAVDDAAKAKIAMTNIINYENTAYNIIAAVKRFNTLFSNGNSKFVSSLGTKVTINKKSYTPYKAFVYWLESKGIAYLNSSWRGTYRYAAAFNEATSDLLSLLGSGATYTLSSIAYTFIAPGKNTAYSKKKVTIAVTSAMLNKIKTIINAFISNDYGFNTKVSAIRTYNSGYSKANKDKNDYFPYVERLALYNLEEELLNSNLYFDTENKVVTTNTSGATKVSDYLTNIIEAVTGDKNYHNTSKDILLTNKAGTKKTNYYYSLDSYWNANTDRLRFTPRYRGLFVKGGLFYEYLMYKYRLSADQIFEDGDDSFMGSAFNYLTDNLLSTSLTASSKQSMVKRMYKRVGSLVLANHKMQSAQYITKLCQNNVAGNSKKKIKQVEHIGDLSEYKYRFPSAGSIKTYSLLDGQLDYSSIQSLTEKNKAFKDFTEKFYVGKSKTITTNSSSNAAVNLATYSKSSTIYKTYLNKYISLRSKYDKAIAKAEKAVTTAVTKKKSALAKNKMYKQYNSCVTAINKEREIYKASVKNIRVLHKGDYYPYLDRYDELVAMQSTLASYYTTQMAYYLSEASATDLIPEDEYDAYNKVALLYYNAIVKYCKLVGGKKVTLTYDTNGKAVITVSTKTESSSAKTALTDIELKAHEACVDYYRELEDFSELITANVDIVNDVAKQYLTTNASVADSAITDDLLSGLIKAINTTISGSDGQTNISIKDVCTPPSDWFTYYLDMFSEWSTVLLIKPITKPEIDISNFSIIENKVSDSVIFNEEVPKFEGSYSQTVAENTPDEKLEVLQSYSFTVTDLTTGEQIDYFEDYKRYGEQLVMSYKSDKEYNNDDTYQVTLSIVTNNYYTDSISYNFRYIDTNKDTLPFTIQAFADDDEARVGFKITPDTSAPHTVYTKYHIQRADASEKYSTWHEVIHYSHNFTNEKPVYVYDYSIESDRDYKYRIVTDESAYHYVIMNIPVISYSQVQNVYHTNISVNHNSSTSSTTSSDNIVRCSFDYSYLVAGGKQLNIKFNNKISSFKNNVSETKFEPLDSRYPFIVKNGKMYYRSFSLSCLISLEADENHIFFESFDDYEGTNNNRPLEKYAKERIFRDAVYDFLHENKYFLFKSASEGNIIIKLMDISYTPEEKLGRMIYSMSGTAYECYEFNAQNILDLNIQPLEDWQTFASTTGNSIEINNKIETVDISDASANLLILDATTINGTVSDDGIITYKNETVEVDDEGNSIGINENYTLVTASDYYLKAGTYYLSTNCGGTAIINNSSTSMPIPAIITTTDPITQISISIPIEYGDSITIKPMLSITENAEYSNFKTELDSIQYTFSASELMQRTDALISTDNNGNNESFKLVKLDYDQLKSYALEATTVEGSYRLLRTINDLTFKITLCKDYSDFVMIKWYRSNELKEQYYKTYNNIEEDNSKDILITFTDFNLDTDSIVIGGRLDTSIYGDNETICALDEINISFAYSYDFYNELKDKPDYQIVKNKFIQLHNYRDTDNLEDYINKRYTRTTTYEEALSTTVGKKRVTKVEVVPNVTKATILIDTIDKNFEYEVNENNKENIKNALENAISVVVYVYFTETRKYYVEIQDGNITTGE